MSDLSTREREEIELSDDEELANLLRALRPDNSHEKILRTVSEAMARILERG